MIKIYNENAGSRKGLLSDFRGHIIKSLSNAKKSDYPKFDGSIGFNIFEKIYAPNNSGVYFVHDLRGILYIGKARNIHNRFTQHTWISKLKFSWVNTKDEQTADKFEKKWIRIFKPICCDKYYYKQ